MSIVRSRFSFSFCLYTYTKMIIKKKTHNLLHDEFPFYFCHRFFFVHFVFAMIRFVSFHFLFQFSRTHSDRGENAKRKTHINRAYTHTNAIFSVDGFTAETQIVWSKMCVLFSFIFFLLSFGFCLTCRIKIRRFSSVPIGKKLPFLMLIKAKIIKQQKKCCFLLLSEYDWK